MGWIILAFFGLVFALVLSPLFIPLILRARLDEQQQEWSIHYGTMMLAPDGREIIEEFIVRWRRRIRPFIPIARVLIRLFRVTFFLLANFIRGFVLLFKTVSWPVRAVINLFGRSREPEEVEVPGEQVTEPVEQPPREETPGPGYEGDRPPGEYEAPFPDDRRFFGEEEPFSGELPEDEEAGEEMPQFARPSLFERIGQVFSKLIQFRNLLTRFGPPGVKSLRLAFGLLGDWFNALHWRRLEARLTLGGDPAALGGALGWYHAFDGAMGGRLIRHFKFEPDFDRKSPAISGSLYVDLWIWPFLLIWPTLRFAARIPWIAWLRAAKSARKEQQA